jgi:hypothetical protein
VLIARLRDRHCRRLLLGIQVPQASTNGWTRTELFALGLVALSTAADSRGRHWYYHDISDYKATPDWLNGRYWAHPERFGKYYW